MGMRGRSGRAGEERNLKTHRRRSRESHAAGGPFQRIPGGQDRIQYRSGRPKNPEGIRNALGNSAAITLRDCEEIEN